MTELPPLEGMAEPVESLAFAPQGPWLFALDSSGTVMVGHVGARKVVKQCALAQQEVGGLVTLGDRHVAIHSFAGEVAVLRLWSRDGEEKTLDAYAEALAKDPGDVGALLRRAQYLLRQGRPHQAMKDLDAAVQADSRRKEGYWLRAMLRARADEQQGALADLDRVVELDPRDALAHYQRGLLLVRMQQYDAARRSLDRAFALDRRLAESVKDE
jgi:tetratricopeptide (TPR) repeat protein